MRRQRTPESYVLSAVLDILAVSRIYAIRLNTFSTRMPNGRMVSTHSGGPGTADVLAFPNVAPNAAQVVKAWSIRPLWIECKSASGKQSPEQKRFQADVEVRGHSYLIARGSDDVLRWLKEHGAR